MSMEMPGLPPARCPGCKKEVDGFFPNPTAMPGDLASLSFMCTLCGTVVSVQVLPRMWLPKEMQSLLAQMDEAMAAMQSAESPIQTASTDDVIEMNPRLRETLDNLRKRRTQ